MPGGTRQSTRTVQREGITFSFAEARIIVGAIVTRIIGSSWSASRGSTARTRPSADHVAGRRVSQQRLERTPRPAG